MSTTPIESSVEKKEYKAPPGATREMAWTSATGETLNLQATSAWMVLRKKEKPAAEMFYTSYRLAKFGDVSSGGRTASPSATPNENRKVNASQSASQSAGQDAGQDVGQNVKRPLTFVFNGGPGAASAYLHVGGLGPKRVAFADDGTILPPPVQLVDNKESWVEFTDLVFIDPIGTGFSRVIDPAEAGVDKAGDKEKKDPAKTVDEKEFYQLNRDLESLGEFIERFLSQNKLWDVPVYIAGESYGGFRTAKLARRLQEKHGIGLCGAIAISPALEWSLLNESDYDVLRSIDTFCTMALAAAFHGRSRVFSNHPTIESMRAQIEAFATRELAHALLVGTAHEEKALSATFSRAADFLGLPVELLESAHGRVPFWRFARALLKERREIIGFYDATITAVDPFPDREMHEAPDPTLTGVERVFCSGINQYLREEIGIESDRRYDLISYEVNTLWKRDEQKHAFDPPAGATDDLRFAMCMNPAMKVLVCHGYYDMVTPYFSSERLVEQMKLLPAQRKNLHMRHFNGGHMFYTWADSRVAFRDWIRQIY